MATYNYKGTKITGTSTSAKIFKKSGIAHAKKNQTYFNTSTGHVYKCDTAGSASKAKWKYDRTDIAKKPTQAVQNLGVPQRVTVGTGTHYLRCEWKQLKVDTKRGDRPESLVRRWYIGIEGTDPKVIADTQAETVTSCQINLSSFKVGSKTYTRNSFYPFTSKHLAYVTFMVAPKNSKGTGPAAKVTRKFLKPRAPQISAFSFNTETGEASCTITTNAGLDYQERYDTAYTMTVTNTRTGAVTKKSNTLTATEFTIANDAVDYQQLSYDEHIQVNVKTWARGYAGKSAVTEKNYYVSYPAQASIEDVDISSRSSTGKCTVKLKTNSTTEHPVDRVILEYLANCSYATADEIPGDADWTASDIIDDAQCTALAIGVSELIPDRGRYTWVRLKTYHANETVLYRYSGYRRLEALETPAADASDDSIAIVSATAGADGESAVVQLGWNDGAISSTGTELTWADAEDAWKSTKAPDSHEFDWEDEDSNGDPVPVTYGGVTYPHSATITIKGLDDATTYYIRARRYNEGDTTTYSEYSNRASVLTSEIPASIVASCDRYVPTGESLPIFWTFSGNGIQTSWQVITADEKAIIAEGEGSLGTTQISAERLASLAVDNSISLKVRASTGSEFVTSDTLAVTIMDNPVLSLTVPAMLAAQPFAFTATVDKLSDLTVIVTSQGATGQTPTGLQRQTAGDTVYSGALVPEWTADGDTWTTTVTLPGGLDFWNLGHYTVSVIASDRATGLQSEEQIANFDIAWAAPAVDPTDAITITPIDEVDANDNHIQGVDIALTPPTGSASTDLFDIYRLTGDGAKLIGESFPLTYTARDVYAPFGDAMTHHYRIALRTADGDTDFADIEYTLDGGLMRFDWAGGSLELPYNLSIADTYKKDFELRKHVSGDSDGYWNQGIERTASLNSDVIRLDQQDDIDKARQLARYTGPVFVRTPDGSAYEADVQVTDLSTEGVLTAIAIDATEIGLTDEFILPTPYAIEEES